MSLQIVISQFNDDKIELNGKLLLRLVENLKVLCALIICYIELLFVQQHP